MDERMLRIGTRGSPLARWQAEHVAEALGSAHPGVTIELVLIRTGGDRDRASALADIGGTGLFTKEIQQALLDGTVDVAVHSLKDLPTVPVPGLVLAAIPPREASGDALVAPRARTLDALPPGARVGTGSPRRRAQLLWLRPDLEIVPIRGNVETRLAMARDGRLDAVVLAEAGLNRLGLDAEITERLGPPRFLPAVGQGALGIEARADDQATRAMLAVLDDRDTRAAVEAERAALATLQAGCLVPLGAWGRVQGEAIHLDVALFEPDGKDRLIASGVAPVDRPTRLGQQLAGQLLGNHATE